MSNPPSPVADPVASAVTVASVPSQTPPAPAPRKFPAPCWSQDETMALINAYKDKWYALRCRNLRSADWDSVASDLFSRCPPSAPPSTTPKTSAQCRHKMEKLRKRYRTEKQRALAHPNRFFASSWLFFDLMDSMETGSSSNGGSGSGSGPKPATDPPKPPSFFDLESRFKQTLTGSDNNDHHHSSVPIKFKFKTHGSSLGFDDASRFDRHLDAQEDLPRYDSRSDRKQGAYYDSGRFDPRQVPNGVPSGVSKRSRVQKRGSVPMVEDDELLPNANVDPNAVVGEMVRSIRVLGEGFVKMEKMKVEMVRDIERMRMEMEMKRSEMTLESQQMIVNAFVEGILATRSKKSKKVVD